MVGYIYLIIDLLTRKKYVGKHHYHKPELDPNYHGSGRIIKRLYKKRPETLKMEYIKTCYSEEELNEWEKYFIFVFNTLHPNGYNLTEGGDGGIKCEEINRKISETLKGRPSPMKGKHHSDEVRKKMSESRKGENSPFFGKHLSEESIIKRTEKRTGIYNTKISKPVVQLTLDGKFVREWESMHEAGRNGFSYQKIYLCCRGIRKSHKGFRWEYK